MNIHLVDATYELFRAHFGAPSATAPDGRPVGAVRGLLRTLLALVRQDDVTHVGCAFDHVIESFRNDMFAGYKTGEGVAEELMPQFGPAERAATALGIVVWPMVEFEADDAIATAAERWRDDPDVDQVVVCSPDKDLAQLVTGDRIVCLDRRRNITLYEAGVHENFGVAPEYIPDYLALVGDSADGIPGVPRWGAKSTAHVLARYRHIEDIPADPADWQVTPRGARTMADSLAEHSDAVMLYRRLATLRLDVPRREFEALCTELGFDALLGAPHRWSEVE